MAKAVVHVNKFPGNNKTNMFMVESVDKLIKSGLMLVLMFLLGMIVCAIILGIVYYFLLRCKTCPSIPLQTLQPAQPVTTKSHVM